MTKTRPDTDDDIPGNEDFDEQKEQRFDHRRTPPKSWRIHRRPTELSLKENALRGFAYQGQLAQR